MVRTGHEQRPNNNVGKRMMMMDVDGRRRKGVPNRRWMDGVNVNFRDQRTVWGGDANPGCVEATCQNHRPHIETGSDIKITRQNARYYRVELSHLVSYG